MTTKQTSYISKLSDVNRVFAEFDRAYGPDGWDLDSFDRSDDEDDELEDDGYTNSCTDQNRQYLEECAEVCRRNGTTLSEFLSEWRQEQDDEYEDDEDDDD